MKMWIRYSIFISIVILFCRCEKEKTPQYTFTVQGKVINSDNGKPAAGIMVYNEFGHPCCLGLAQKLGGDSVKTDAQGQYQMTLTYPEDTLNYRFITYLKASPMIDKFYYYSGAEFQGLGVTAFDYAEMILPGTITKLPDNHTQTCNFSIIQIGLLQVGFKPQVNPVADTVRIVAKRLDNNQTYKEAFFYPLNYSGGFNLPIPAGIPTELTQTSEYLGVKKIRKDTFNLVFGQKSNVLFEH